MRAIAACVLIAFLVSVGNAVVIHFPPNATNINNFAFVINGTGAPGIFNSSNTPAKQYGEYNWCNMPHVRTTEYKSVFATLAKYDSLTTESLG
jgi:acid phosphatase